MVTPPSGYYGLFISQLSKGWVPQHKGFCSKIVSHAMLGKVQCQNGSIQYKFYCNECGGKAGGNLPHSYISDLDDSKIPFLTIHEIMSCERCGSMEGSEIHHWAPQHLFGNLEASCWPTSYLCRKCHLLWHSIVTPNM